MLANVGTLWLCVVVIGSEAEGSDEGTAGGPVESDMADSWLRLCESGLLILSLRERRRGVEEFPNRLCGDGAKALLSGEEEL